jgi:hypothetical protein
MNIILQSIPVLVGVIIGGLISVFIGIANNVHQKKMRILDEQMLIYKEISKKIVENKLKYEETIGEIVKDRNEPKLTKEQRINLIDELTNIHKQYYFEFFQYAFLLPKEILEPLEKLFQLMGKALNPEYAFNTVFFENLENSYNEIEISLSKKIGCNNCNIKIQNPHFLVNQNFKE